MDPIITLLSNLPATALVFVLSLAVIGGMGYIIFLLIQQRNAALAQHAELTGNHLHELPLILDALRRIETQLGALAVGTFGQLADVRESLATVKAKLNGKS